MPGLISVGGHSFFALSHRARPYSTLSNSITICSHDPIADCMRLAKLFCDQRLHSSYIIRLMMCARLSVKIDEKKLPEDKENKYEFSFTLFDNITKIHISKYEDETNQVMYRIYFSTTGKRDKEYAENYLTAYVSDLGMDCHIEYFKTHESTKCSKCLSSRLIPTFREAFKIKGKDDQHTMDLLYKSMHAENEKYLSYDLRIDTRYMRIKALIEPNNIYAGQTCLEPQNYEYEENDEPGKFEREGNHSKGLQEKRKGGKLEQLLMKKSESTKTNRNNSLNESDLNFQSFSQEMFDPEENYSMSQYGKKRPIDDSESSADSLHSPVTSKLRIN